MQYTFSSFDVKNSVGGQTDGRFFVVPLYWWKIKLMGGPNWWKIKLMGEPNWWRIKLMGGPNWWRTKLMGGQNWWEDKSDGRTKLMEDPPSIWSSIHQFFLHQFCPPSTFPPSLFPPSIWFSSIKWGEHKKILHQMTSITTNEEKGFSYHVCEILCIHSERSLCFNRNRAEEHWITTWHSTKLYWQSDSFPLVMHWSFLYLFPRSLVCMN